MARSTGSHRVPYEILQPVGAGVMGQVYKAPIHALNRTVAIKVLRQSQASLIAAIVHV
jgi:serine/threonine protein kinase